jgi:putative ABC transport system permease protein
LGGIAVFILLLACINFVNLSTARSANRAKEVGLRKVVGSVRGYLVRQFLTESILFSFLSFLLAILIVVATLPYFNRVIGASLAIPWSAWWFLPVLLAASVIVGIFAGVYPSVYLSSFKPIEVLKGSISRGARSSVLRGTLVVFQFTVSIVLLIGTFVIHRQMNFILNTKIGFDKEQVIMIEGANTMGENQRTFKEELSSLAGVQHVTISSYLPVQGTKRDQNGFWLDGKSEEQVSIGAQRWYVDDDYLAALGIKLLEGRNFDPTVASDSQAIIINRAMARELNLTNPVGSRIQNWETWTVIGVVEDFHFESMKGKIEPLSLVYGKWGQIISVKVNTSDMQQTIKSITKVWDRFMPHQAIRYSFLDESYARMYADVERVGRVFTIFAILAIVVACLGLFALSAFMVEQRGKEISIRLVLGASVSNIFRLLTQNFVMLVMISLVIGAPIGWYAMKWWLEDYEYRITIGWDVFVLAGSMAVLIALLTVCYQSLKVATDNPVERLRND